MALCLRHVFVDNGPMAHVPLHHHQMQDWVLQDGLCKIATQHGHQLLRIYTQRSSAVLFQEIRFRFAKSFSHEQQINQKKEDDWPLNKGFIQPQQNGADVHP